MASASWIMLALLIRDAFGGRRTLSRVLVAGQNSGLDHGASVEADNSSMQSNIG